MGQVLQGSPSSGDRQLTDLASSLAVVVLAGASGAGEQVCVGNAPLLDGLAKGRGDVVLAHQITKPAGAPFAIIDLRSHIKKLRKRAQLK